MSLREQKKLKNKNAILQAAISLFNENGFENTSIEQISRAAGVGKGTVYSYFQTKKDIIKGFCEYEFDLIHSELVARSNQEAPVLEQMLIIYMTEFKQVTQNREFGRMYMRESMFPDDIDLESNLEMENKYFSLLFPIFKKGQERGELREDLELLHITAHFYSLFVIIISAWYTGRIQKEDVEQVMSSMFQQALQGLQPGTIKTTECEKSHE